jgi:hypothetical protein
MSKEKTYTLRYKKSTYSLEEAKATISEKSISTTSDSESDLPKALQELPNIQDKNNTESKKDYISLMS